MGSEEAKRRVAEEIDRRADMLIQVGEDIFRDPELGFKEFRTERIVTEVLRSLDLQVRSSLAITGVKTVVEGGQPGPTVAVLGELDSVLVADHQFCNPQTGAAHCCGHNAQIATMLGTAMGILGAGVLPELAGRIAFFAVPAEEYVEIDYRNGLRKAGKIEFLGGKSELIARGEFDDVDMAMMVHGASSQNTTGIASVAASNNGFVGKQARFVGTAAHAGGAPDRGINALYAAQIALASINAQRETFRDEDAIRVHPILTRGGDLVNVIPNDVRLESYVRGKTTGAIEGASKKVDRALRAGAVALGARVEIETLPGYMPLFNNRAMADAFKGNFLRFYGAEEWEETGHRTGSTDMGDIAHIMPALHPHVSGFSGTGHGSDWAIADKYLAYVLPAKLMALTVIDLLSDGAAQARGILERDKPPMTKDEYLAFMRRNAVAEDFDG
ncbi:MAG TPA: amidohydrolase, partial [Thermomicrobiaceae bacterium]|nr:amidohydrolase [Thermomicrobiaceae bacterium]